MKKKYYTYPLGFIPIILLALIFVLLVIVFLKTIDYFFLFGIVVIIISIMYGIKKRYLEYVEINSYGIIKKGRKIHWDNVKITMHYPIGHHIRGYLIFFGDKYFSHDDIKNEFKNGFYFYARINRLSFIFTFYRIPIKILEEVKTGKNILKFVEEHNKKEERQVHK